ncbi:MAG: hypothetical protein QM733_05950 [Ilumatobacteraceae bacterium]
MPVVLLTSFALGSCSSSGKGDEQAVVNGGLPVPPSQAWAFAGDGKITRAEYQQGFDNFASCLAESGIKLVQVSTDANTGLITYGSLESDSSEVNRCYWDQFQSIDATFQTTDERILEARDREAVELLENTVFPCLEKNGIEVPAIADPALAGDKEFMEQFLQFSNAGRC